MLKVFICEDNIEYRQVLENIVEKCILIEDLYMELEESYACPNDLINYIKNKHVNGIYLLDIDLNSNINGIQLAQEIRKYDPRGYIIFITSHIEMSYITFLYRVEAMDYIIKGNTFEVEERVRACIINSNRMYCSIKNEEQKNFTIKINGSIISIDYDKIVFFETSHKIHKVVLHTTDRCIEFYGKMKEIEKTLDSRFYRCHRSFIVNKNNIKSIDYNNKVVNMVNGDQCILSSRMLKGLLNK